MEEVDRLACDIQDLHNTLSYYIEEGLIRDTEMNMRVDILTTQVGELNTSIRGLLTVWEQARGVLTVIRWLLWASGSVLALIAFFKGTKG